ncbi:MAG: hypothetical protein HYU57_03485, partial [Micavibrio aeruginosavorus]|nr:hypothetical protein [Micavibrio aeruginosavorus]
GKSAAQFCEYLSQQRKTPLGDIAEAESRRLAPYFSALEKRLDRDQPADGIFGRIKAVITHHPVPPAPEPPEQKEKKSLCRTFNKVAADTKNVIISEFSIIPETMLKDPAVSAMEGRREIRQFFKRTRHNDADISLGFIQCMQDGGAGSVTVPVAALDLNILKNIKEFDTKTMMTSLQDVLTAVNHDMMHHLTNTCLNNDVSNTPQAVPYAAKLNTFIAMHARGRDETPGSYESWALLSHADTWREMRGTEAEKDLNRAIDTFYDSLSRLDGEMKIAGKTESQRAAVIDHFSVLGAFALMRIHPFNDPAMIHALDRIEALDPAPLRIFTNYTQSYRNRNEIVANPAIEQRLHAIFHDLLGEPEGFIRNAASFMLSALSNYNDAAPFWNSPKIDVSALMDYVDHGGKIPPDTEEITASYRALDLALKYDRDIDLDSPDTESSVNPHFKDINLSRVSRMIAATTLYHISTDPEQSAKHEALIRDCCTSDLERLRHEALDRHFYALQTSADHQDMLLGTLFNYMDTDHAPIGKKGDAATFRGLKQLELIQLAPEIAFLASPAENSPMLAKLRQNARKVDEGVRNILQKN